VILSLQDDMPRLLPTVHVGRVSRSFMVRPRRIAYGVGCDMLCDICLWLQSRQNAVYSLASPRFLYIFSHPFSSLCEVGVVCLLAKYSLDSSIAVGLLHLQQQAILHALVAPPIQPGIAEQ